MTKINMTQAIEEAKEGFTPRFYGGAYGDRMHFDLSAEGAPVYARTPFDDLNGSPLTESDLVRDIGSILWIESGRPDPAPATKPAPFMFFAEV